MARTAKKSDTRGKILEAAADISRESGPGNLSLDAVAARAGVSKGGLLYHFPSKTKLLQAVVENFIASFDEELARRKEAKHGRPDALLEAYLELFVEDHDCRRPPPSGLLAALSQDPDFLAPVRRHNRALIDRMRQAASDPAMALVVYLAIQGVRGMNLLGLDVMSDAEFAEAVDKLKALAGGA
jgi:AcrR family transcriptional regulator